MHTTNGWRLRLKNTGTQKRQQKRLFETVMQKKSFETQIHWQWKQQFCSRRPTNIMVFHIAHQYKKSKCFTKKQKPKKTNKQRERETNLIMKTCSKCAIYKTIEN